MNNLDMMSFYERHFFHELDVKEKITVKAQISFAAIFTIATGATYMLRVLDFDSNLVALGAFIILSAAHFLLLGAAIILILRAFWDNEFRYMPIASSIADYTNDLEKYNRDISIFNSSNPPAAALEPIDISETTAEFLKEKYIECASHNALTNAKRSENLHRGIGWIIYSGFPLFIAAGAFVIFDMDASSPRKNALVADQAVADHLHFLNSNISLLKQNMSNAEKNTEKEAIPKAPTKPKQPPARVSVEDFPSSKELADERQEQKQ